MSIGEIIRKIRLNKAIPSNVLYKDLLSRPAIVKFERGESDTTVQKILIIIDRLNISLEEFEMIFKKDNSSKSFTRKYSVAFYNKDINKLNELFNQSKSEYQNNKDEKFLHHQAIIQLLINDLTNVNINTETHEVQILKNYLVKCETWGYYELTLFTNSLTYYPEELIDLVYKRAKNALSIYDYQIRYRNELSILLLNILEKKILSKNINSAEFYLNELKELKVFNMDSMYVTTMIKYFHCIIKIALGEKQYKNDILMICDYLNFLEMHLKSDQCLKLLNFVENSFKK